MYFSLLLLMLNENCIKVTVHVLYGGLFHPYSNNNMSICNANALKKPCICVSLLPLPPSPIYFKQNLQYSSVPRECSLQS